MKIITHWTHEPEGYPGLVVETDQGRLYIGLTQKFAADFGIVFCGVDSRDFLPPITLPADPSDGRAALTLRGFTNNPEILELYWQFYEAMEELPRPARWR